MLEEAALGTDLVEVRRVHRVIELEGAGERASMVVEGPGGRYRHEAPFALGCDGAKSGVRRMLGIRNG